MLKILHARLQHYVNQELPDVQAGFRKGRGTEDEVANLNWIIEKVGEFQKNICFINYTKAFDCMDHDKLGNLLERWEYQSILPASRETCMQGKKQLEPCTGQLTGAG